MNLEELVQQDLLKAMRAKNDTNVNQEENNSKIMALRAIKAEIMKAKTAPGFDAEKFKEADIIKIMQKMCKDREETAEIYKANGREDLAEKEISEKNYINIYLPKPADEAEVEAIVIKIISETGASSMKDMGTVIREASAVLGTRSDGKTISTIVKRNLNK